jgi:hypothetical protein
VCVCVCVCERERERESVFHGENFSVTYEIVWKLRILTTTKSKGKVRPTLSSTSALDRGGWLTPRSSRFIPRKEPVPIV